MGKRQHQKDKMVTLETADEDVLVRYQGRHPGKHATQKHVFTEPCTRNSVNKDGFKRLPFDHCSLSLQPFENPLCSPEGHVFDLMNIVPYLKKYGINPITGKKLEAKSLIRLNFHKNSDGKYHCPVLYKLFNDSSNIVAIKPTGNVFCFEAVDQLNLKAKNFIDLLTDEPFAREDIITLQDPEHLEKFNFSQFHHLKNNLKVEDEEERKAKKNPNYYLKSVSAETKDILDELNREYKPKEKQQPEKTVAADRFNAAHYSTGAVSVGFTSTVMEPATSHEPAILDDDLVRFSRVKKKGYVRLTTNFGPLNLEVHCDMVPKICENFLKLCSKSYYDGVIFHRSIKHFMIQGGDPAGTGKGGESHWGKAIKDHFKPNLTHTGRGILSMANSGPDTNKSQFFITYRSCKHLDGKHSVFGRLVGGQDTLNLMEKVPTDAKDRPKDVIRIIKADVFVDPFQEVDDALAKERELDEQERIREQKKAEVAPAASKTVKTFKSGVGKYINPTATRTSTTDQADVPSKKSKREGTGTFNFNSW